MPGGAYPAFVSNYKKVSDLLAAEDFSAAKTKIEEMIAKGNVRLLYEYAFIQIALYRAEFGLGNQEAALRAIRRATPVMNFQERAPTAPDLGTRINTNEQLLETALLPKLPFSQALGFRFYIDAQLGHFIDALETFDRMQKVDGISREDPFAQTATAIKEALASPNPLSVSAQILDGTWSLRPARRTFTLANIKGRATTIGVACDRRTATLLYQQDVEWTLPESWGDCELTIRGDEGTSFQLVEFPAILSATQGEPKSFGKMEARPVSDLREPAWPAPPHW